MGFQFLIRKISSTNNHTIITFQFCGLKHWFFFKMLLGKKWPVITAETFRISFNSSWVHMWQLLSILFAGNRISTWQGRLAASCSSNYFNLRLVTIHVHKLFFVWFLHNAIRFAWKDLMPQTCDFLLLCGKRKKNKKTINSLSYILWTFKNWEAKDFCGLDCSPLSILWSQKCKLTILYITKTRYS